MKFLPYKHNIYYYFYSNDDDYIRGLKYGSLSSSLYIKSFSFINLQSIRKYWMKYKKYKAV